MNTIHALSYLAVRRQHGLTLVELMVALVLSLVLAAGVIQLFIGTKQTYRFYDALSRLQENGRFALDAMASDIRMAGYIVYPYPNPARNNPSPPIQPSPPWNNALQGPNNLNDLITARWFDPCPTTGCPVNSNSQQCNRQAPVNGICSRGYSIRPRTPGGVVPTCQAAGASLFLRRDNANLQELIEGVEAIQILYGVCATDADGDGTNDTVTSPPGYQNAAAITAANEWSRVCSARIDLLMVSLEDRVVSQPQAIFFPPNIAWPVNDRCLRQVFSTTIAIRNRLR